MVRIGITGGMGAGKSTISKMFNLHFKIPVYDSDSRAKHLTDYNDDLKAEIKKILPHAYYGTNEGVMNKKYVADMIFKDNSLRKQLQDLVHPYLWEDFDNWCEENKESPYVIFESAILIEAGITDKFDKIIVVTADLEARLDRLETFRNISREKALERIESQTSDLRRLEYADFVIRNDKNLNVSKLHWKKRKEEEVKEKMEAKEIDVRRKDVLLKRIEQIDHKIKYISYGGNNEEQS